MIEKIRRILFFILIFSIPNQFGKHFWPSFAFVTGIRIDYLSPTLYITDIIIILMMLLLIWKGAFLQLFKPFKSMTNLSFQFFILFILGAILSTFLSRSPGAAFYADIRFLEMAFVVLYIKTFFQKKDITLFVDTLALSALCMCFIAVLQFVLQHSVGGLFYFIGERTFNVLTPSIATIHYDGGLLLRPYGTFPHPNVLSFFLLIVFLFSSMRISYETDMKEKFFLIFSSCITGIVLVLTFSRVSIVLFILFLLWNLVKKWKKKIWAFGFIGAISLFIALFSTRFLNLTYLGKDILLRADLIGIALQIFEKSPLIGVGPKNFFFYESTFQKVFSPSFLQPVHNIYLLILAELGIIGLSTLFFFIIIIIKQLSHSTSQKPVRAFYSSIYMCVIALLTVGMFDHFPLTLYQGELMTSVLVGLALTSWKK